MSLRKFFLTLAVLAIGAVGFSNDSFLKYSYDNRASLTDQELDRLSSIAYQSIDDVPVEDRIRALINLGLAYRYRNQVSESVRSYFNAIKLSKTSSLNKYLPESYRLLGVSLVYANRDEAEIYFKQAANLSASLSDSVNLNKSYISLALFNMDKERYAVASDYLDSVLVKNSFIKGYIAFCEGKKHYDLSDYDRSLQAFTESEAVFQESGDTLNSIKARVNALLVSFMAGNEKDIEARFDLLLTQALRIGDADLLQSIYRNQYLLHTQLGNTVRADSFASLSYQIGTQLIESSYLDPLSTAELLYEKDLSQATLRTLTAEREVQDLRLRLIVIAAISMAVIFILTLLMLRSRRKAKEEMMRLTLELQRAERESISADLHNGVINIVSGLNLLANNDSLDRRSLTSALKEIREKLIEVATEVYPVNLSSDLGLSYALEELALMLDEKNKMRLKFSDRDYRGTKKTDRVLYHIINDFVGALANDNQLKELIATVRSKNSSIELLIQRVPTFASDIVELPIDVIKLQVQLLQGSIRPGANSVLIKLPNEI